MDSVDIDIAEEDDEAAWKRRREGLRAFVDTIANHVQTLALPESYLEAERCVRSLTVSDRALQLLPTVEADLLNDKEAPAIKPIRRHIRVYADRVLDIVPRFPLPETFLEVERANRYALSADRMLAQLYGPAQMITPKAVAKTSEITVRGRPACVENEDDEDAQNEEERHIARRLAIKRKYFQRLEMAQKADAGDDSEPESNQADRIAAQRRKLEAIFCNNPRDKVKTAQTTGLWEDGTPYTHARSHDIVPPCEDSGPGLRSLSP